MPWSGKHLVRADPDYPGRKDNIDEIVNLITEAIAFPSRSLHIGDLTVPPA